MLLLRGVSPTSRKTIIDNHQNSYKPNKKAHFRSKDILYTHTFRRIVEWQGVSNLHRATSFTPQYHYDMAWSGSY
jgi:hypothetical protein